MIGTAQVVHALTGRTKYDLPNYTSWPTIGRCLVAFGCDWPAAADLAAMTAISQQAVVDAVTDLAEQAGREFGDLPPLDFWDTVCGLVGRSWRLGLLDEVGAAYRMGDLWWLIRHLDGRDHEALKIIWEGMWLKELVAFRDIDDEAASLLNEADRFIPPGAVDGPLCEALLDGIE